MSSSPCWTKRAPSALAALILLAAPSPARAACSRMVEQLGHSVHAAGNSRRHTGFALQDSMRYNVEQALDYCRRELDAELARASQGDSRAANRVMSLKGNFEEINRLAERTKSLTFLVDSRLLASMSGNALRSANHAIDAALGTGKALPTGTDRPGLGAATQGARDDTPRGVLTQVAAEFVESQGQGAVGTQNGAPDADNPVNGAQGTATSTTGPGSGTDDRGGVGGIARGVQNGLTRGSAGFGWRPKGSSGEGAQPSPVYSPEVLAKAEREMSRRFPNNPEASRLLAEANLTGGNGAAAQRHASEALRLNPDDAAALGLRARARAFAGDSEGSVEDARRLAKLEPENELAKYIIGNRDQLSASREKLRRASLDFGAARQEGELGAEGAQDRAALAAAGGVWGAAALAPVAYTALPLSPLGQRFYDAALAKLKVGDATGALMDATRAVGADPKSHLPLVLRAQISRALRNPQGAADDATKALELRPDDANALRERALAFLHLGRLDEALADLRRAVELEPASGVSYYYRALVYEKLGRTEDALADLERAARLESALKPLTDEVAARLKGARAAPLERLPGRFRPLVRAVGAVLSLLLVLFGLVGTQAGRELLTTTARRALGSKDEDATVLETAPELAPGSIIGGLYRVERELGRGGMGVVYAATDVALERRVAVKRLQRDSGSTSEDLERLLEEARTVARLKHPRIAEIFNVLTEGDLFLVFEYVDGRPLDEVLRERLRLSVAETRRVVADVAAAIGCAHEQRVIHRDLKPANVMLETGGGCKVMDFGIAHRASGAATMTRTSASGTPPYMAPEQALGSVSKASDLYALAVMTYELLTGRRPFQGPDFLEQKLGKVFAAPSSIDPSLPKGLDAFYARALDPDPTKRHASAAEFLAAWDRACA